MNDKISGVDSPQDRSELNLGSKESKNKNIFIGVGILFVILVLGIAFAMSIGNFENAVKEEVVLGSEVNFDVGNDQSVVDESGNYFERLRLDKERKERIELERAAAEAIAENELKSIPVVTKTTNTPPRQPKPSVDKKSTGGRDKNAPPTPAERRLLGSVVIGAKASSNNSRAVNTNTSFDNPIFEDGIASLRPENSLDFMLIHGTSIPCALYTQIISDYQGYVTCKVINDIYSANGSTLLVERGSTVSGLQKVKMEQGKGRIFTSWADIETPLGASIRIDSLGAGPLGASGSAAWIDNHYAERFGGAILLSLVDDMLGILVDKNSNSVQFDSSTENASDMASKALESSINISPTGYSFIGQRINILVARDIDMSSIYQFGNE